MSKRRKLKYTFQNRTALFLKETSSGLVAGLPIAEDPTSPHLMMIYERNAVRRHVARSDGVEKEHIELGKTSPEQMATIRRFVRSHLTRILPYRKAWAPTEMLLRAMMSAEGEPDPSAGLFFPPGVRKELINPDLTNAAKWSETTVGRLSPNDYVLALSEVHGEMCLIFPTLDGRFTLAVPFDELDAITPYLGEFTGFGSLVRLLLKDSVSDQEPPAHQEP